MPLQARDRPLKSLLGSKSGLRRIQKATFDIRRVSSAGAEARAYARSKWVESPNDRCHPVPAVTAGFRFTSKSKRTRGSNLRTKVDRIRIGSAKTRVPRAAGGGGCGREGGSSGRPVGAACSRRSAALRGARRSAMGRRATRSAPRAGSSSLAAAGRARRRAGS